MHIKLDVSVINKDEEKSEFSLLTERREAAALLLPEEGSLEMLQGWALTPTL